MPAVAHATEGPESEQRNGIQSDDWPEETDGSYSLNGDRVQFSGDGLNTGVRVRGSIFHTSLSLHISRSLMPCSFQ